MRCWARSASLRGRAVNNMAEQKQGEGRVVFSRPKSLLPVVTNYCPGCPHGIVHRLVAEVIDELDIEGRTAS